MVEGDLKRERARKREARERRERKRTEVWHEEDRLQIFFEW